MSIEKETIEKFSYEEKQKRQLITTEIGREKAALNLIEDKIKLLQTWLIDHFDNSYAIRVRKDLLALQVERSTRERIIYNLKCGLPSHGEQLFHEHKVENQNQKQTI